jgi:pimeloyl-ACP methyl ester carboxylesterase
MYAHLFPTHVRALALDAVLDPAARPLDVLLLRTAGFEANLQALLADCRAYVGCEYAREGDPGARLADLLQRLDLNPIPVGNRMLTRTLATAAVLLSLYHPRDWPGLTSALNYADQGNGQLLLTLADIFEGRHAHGSYTNMADADAAINCLDQPGPSDIASYDRLGPAMAKASPILGPALQYSWLVCAYWPVKAKNLSRPLDVKGAPPILLVGGTKDPATPYAFAQAVNAQIPGSVLLTRQGYGHPSYDKSVCVREAMDAYLLDLTLPAQGTVCDSDFP